MARDGDMQAVCRCIVNESETASRPTLDKLESRPPMLTRHWQKR